MIRQIKKFDFLKPKIINKTILHVGCCGIVKKLEIEKEKKNYLHKFLYDNSKKTYGLDVDKDELNYLKKFGFDNLIYGNAEHIEKINFGTNFDIIILGNVFNYFVNPGLLLQNTHNLLNKNGSIIITIENYFSAKKLLRYIFFSKYPDFYHHCFSVNKNTLKNLVKKSNFEILDYGFFFEGPDNFLVQSIKSKISNFILQIFTKSEKYSDGYIIEIRKKNE